MTMDSSKPEKKCAMIRVMVGEIEKGQKERFKEEDPK